MPVGRPSEPLYCRKQRVRDRRGCQSHAHDCSAFIARRQAHSRRSPQNGVGGMWRQIDCRVRAMKTVTLKIAAVALAWTCVLVTPVLPWGQEGHSIIAEIA